MRSWNLHNFLRTGECVDAESGNRGARKFREVSGDCFRTLEVRSAERPQEFARILPRFSVRSHAEEKLDVSLAEWCLAIDVEIPLDIAAPVKKRDKDVKILVVILAIFFARRVAGKLLQRASIASLRLRYALPQMRLRARYDQREQSDDGEGA